MKTIYFTLIILMFSFISSNAQLVTNNYILNTPITDIIKYEVPTNSNTVSIPTTFSHATPDSTVLKAFKTIKRNAVIKIDFVYTQFHVSDSFSQRNLNEKRLVALRKFLPEIFENNVIEWNLINQTGCNSEDICKTWFHGFVFHLKNKTTPLTPEDAKRETEQEISFIEGIIKDAELNDTSIRKSFTVSKRFWSYVKEPTGKYLPHLGLWRALGIKYKSAGYFNRTPEMRMKKIKSDSISIKEYPGYIGWFNCFNYQLTDSVIFKSFNRFTNLHRAVVVEDVTGSMYPYTLQTLVWRRMNIDIKGFDRFVFFNDGDARPDGPIGKSGGYYAVQSDSVKEIEKMLFKAMRGGGGGAAPENDLEALLYANSKFKEADYFILVADNYAAVRDLSLLSKLSKPTKIIICGSLNGNVLIDYIKIALQTGGSICTIEDEINFAGKKEFSEFSVGKQKFIVTNGKLELIR